MKTLVRTLLASLFAMALLSTAASADVANRPFEGTLVSGQPVIAQPPEKDEPGIEDACGVAVEGSGRAFISDYYHRAIKIFTGSTKVDEITGVGTPSNGPCGLAFDSADNLYVNLWHGPVLEYPAPYETSVVVDPGPASGIALDPASGDLYVNSRNRITVYEAPIVPKAPDLTIGVGSLVNSFGVAVSDFGATEGQVYAADASTKTVKVFTQAGNPNVPIAEIDGEATPQGATTSNQGFSSLVDSSLAIDQSDGHLFVTDNTQPLFEHPAAVVDEFNAEGLYRGQLAHSLIHAEPVGITVNESPGPRNGHLYVTTGNGSSHVFPGIFQVPPEEETALYLFGLPGAGTTLDVTATGSGVGTVSSNPAGIRCGGSCKAEFDSEAVVTLTATAAAGSIFSGWSGGLCSGTGTCTVTMSGATTVNAEFSPAPAFAGGTGSAVGTASRSSRVESGAGSSRRGMSLGPAKASPGGAALVADAPGAGTLTAKGSGLSATVLEVGEPGRVTLRLHLSPTGRRALAKAKGGKFSTRVKVAFASAGGEGDEVARRVVTFSRGAGR